MTLSVILLAVSFDLTKGINASPSKDSYRPFRFSMIFLGDSSGLDLKDFEYFEGYLRASVNEILTSPWRTLALCVRTCVPE
jgi:hypothetical protein